MNRMNKFIVSAVTVLTGVAILIEGAAIVYAQTIPNTLGTTTASSTGQYVGTTTQMRARQSMGTSTVADFARVRLARFSGTQAQLKALVSGKLAKVAKVKHKNVCNSFTGGNISCFAKVVVDARGVPIANTFLGTSTSTITESASTAALPSGYGPSQLLGAYNLTGLSASPTPPIIGITVAGDDVNIVKDLSTYSAMYGIPQLPTCSGSITASNKPCFQKMNETGAATPLPAPDSSWSLETSLDVEIAHAICQNCSIALVESSSGSWQDMITAVRTAASKAVVVSNSWGSSGEFSGEGVIDSYLKYPGVVLTFSAGDTGYGVGYPAASPNVISVGGTTLLMDGNSYLQELTWAGTGSGCSAYEPKPTWQTDSTCTNRTDNDISADADPATGAAVYDSDYVGYSGWFQTGGTSLSSPIVAAIYALQGKLDAGATAGQQLYANSANLNDVVGGSNGTCTDSYLCNAMAGYDAPTGLGSPNGARLLTITTPVITSITITPATASLTVAAGKTAPTIQLASTELDQFGNPISAPITWASSDPTVAKVSTAGLVTAVGNGTANITASSGYVTSNASVITVAKSVFTTINLTPATASVTFGKAGVQLTATKLDQLGNPMAATLTWTSSDPTIAKVSAAGLVTAVGNGTANITASSGGVTSNASVIISFKPVITTISIVSTTPSLDTSTSVSLIVGKTKAQLVATKLDQLGNPIAATLGWTSDNTSVATVSASGVVTPVSDGTANITASSGGVTSNAFAVTVVSRVITTINITPTSPSLLIVGKSRVQLAATKLDQFGNPIVATLTWTSDNTSVATVNAIGVVTPVGDGTANITASSGGVTSNASVITSAKPVLTTMTISPATASLVFNKTKVQLAVTKNLDQFGSPIAARVMWTSSDSTVASVSAAGLVTPVDNGTANITASSGGVTSNASVISVFKPKLAWIYISPTYPTLIVGKAKVQMASAKHDQANNDIVATLTWASSDPSVATVSANGLVTPLKSGVTYITASSGGITSNAATAAVSTK